MFCYIKYIRYVRAHVPYYIIWGVKCFLFQTILIPVEEAFYTLVYLHLMVPAE